jgi:CheY-like chemotaxis protein
MTASADVRKGVLIVERNVIDRGGLSVILRRAGHPVVAVASAQEGIDAMRADPPGLVLLDATDPAEVQEFLRLCRSDPALASVPITLTAGVPGGAELAGAFGVAGCLRKPFNETELLQEVRKHLG